MSQRSNVQKVLVVLFVPFFQYLQSSLGLSKHLPQPPVLVNNLKSVQVEPEAPQKEEPIKIKQLVVVINNSKSVQVEPKVPQKEEPIKVK